MLHDDYVRAGGARCAAGAPAPARRPSRCGEAVHPSVARNSFAALRELLENIRNCHRVRNFFDVSGHARRVDGYNEVENVVVPHLRKKKKKKK